MAYGGRTEWDSALQFGRQLQNTYFLRRSSALPLNGTIAILDPNIKSADGQPFQTTISGIFHSMLDNGSFNMPSGLYVSTEQVKTVSGYRPSGSTYTSQRNGFPAVVKRFSQEQYEGIANQLEANWYLQAEVEFLASGRPAVVVEGDNPPPIPQKGELWYNTSTLELKVWYIDPAGDAQWVPTAIPLSSQEDFTSLVAEVATISGEVQRDVANLETISGILSSGIATRFSAYGGTISDNPEYFNGVNYTEGNLTLRRGSEESNGGKIYSRNFDNSVRYTIFSDGTFNSTARAPITMSSKVHADAQVKINGISGSYRPLVFKSSNTGTTSTGYKDMLRMVPGRLDAYNSYIVASGITDHMGLAVCRNGVNTWAVDGEGEVRQRSNKYVFDSPAEYTDIYDVGNSAGTLRFITGTNVETAAPSGVRLTIGASGVGTHGTLVIGESITTSTGAGRTQINLGDGTFGSISDVIISQWTSNSSQPYKELINFTSGGNQINVEADAYFQKKAWCNENFNLNSSEQAGLGNWPGLKATSYVASGLYISTTDQKTIISLQQGTNSQLTVAKPGKPSSSVLANFGKISGIQMNQNTAFRSSVVYYTRGGESNVATNEFYPWVISGQSNPSMGYASSIDGKLLYINKTSSSDKGDAVGYTGQIEYPQSLVNKKYVDDAVNNGFAGGGTLTNPVILGTTQFSTSGEGQLLNVLNKPANAGLEIWVGAGSVGSSEQVVNFAKEGVTYIKPTEFQNNVVVQETIPSNGPVSYVQKNIANSIMHELDGRGNVYHAGSGVLNSNLHVKGKSYLGGDVLAQSNLTVNGVLQAKKEVAIEFLNNVPAQKINKYAANPELWFQTGQTASNVEPMLKLKENNFQVGNSQREVTITWNSDQLYQKFLIPPGHVIELTDSSNTHKPQIDPGTCNDWPRMFMQTGARIMNLGDPVDAQDAATKNYVQGLMNGLYSATNASSDFAQLKSNFLTTLSGYIN